MIIEKATSANGTCLQGYVDTNFNRLVEIFGEPNYGPNDPYSGDGKITCEWIVDIDGTLCTIYDWKVYGDTPMDGYDWHIGGNSKLCVEKVLEAMASK